MEPSDTQRLSGLRDQIRDLWRLVDRQAKDEGLWFRATTATEAYMQQELRKLHHCINAVDLNEG